MAVTALLDLDDRAFVEWAASITPGSAMPAPHEWRGVVERLGRLGVVEIPMSALVSEFPSLAVPAAKAWLADPQSYPDRVGDPPDPPTVTGTNVSRPV